MPRPQDVGMLVLEGGYMMNGFYPVLNEIHDKAAKELPLAELALFEHIWRKLIGGNSESR